MPHALRNPKIIVLFFLGFSSGLPMQLVGATLTAWYTSAGISLLGISLLSLIGQPYVYKFIWSPLMDRYIPPFLGRRRGWILLTQLGLIIGLFMMSLLNPAINPMLLALMALAVAFLSASQDISINAYMVDITTPQERGLAAASQVCGYRVAMVIAGALALIMAQYIGWRSTYLMMSTCMLVGVIANWRATEPKTQPDATLSLSKAVFEPFADYFQRFGIKSALLLLGILILYKLGDAYALTLNTPFLLRELHFSLATVGLANKIVGITASIVGSIVGGVIMLRISLFRSLVLFGILQAFSNLTYMWLAMVGHQLLLMIFAIFTEQFCGGLANVAFVALLISLCNPRFSATQYALLSALTAIGRVYVGPSAALIIDHVGWVWFYGWTFIISLPGIGLLFMIRNRV